MQRRNKVIKMLIINELYETKGKVNKVWRQQDREVKTSEEESQIKHPENTSQTPGNMCTQTEAEKGDKINMTAKKERKKRARLIILSLVSIQSSYICSSVQWVLIEDVGPPNEQLLERKVRGKELTGKRKVRMQTDVLYITYADLQTRTGIFKPCFLSDQPQNFCTEQQRCTCFSCCFCSLRRFVLTIILFV